MLKHVKAAFAMFLYFFRIGWFTFGGGYNIVSQIQRDYVEKNHMLEPEELLDIVSVGRSLPGTMIGNVAYLLGYRQAGFLGGFCAVMGIITPPMLILSVLTYFYSTFRDNVYVDRALSGVRSVVPAIIFSSALRLHKGAFPRKICLLIALITCAAMLFFHVSAIVMILFGLISGLLLTLRKEDRL